MDQADLSRRQSDWGAAVEGYKAYLRRDPRDFGIRVRLIRTLNAAGRLDEAGMLLDEARRARPDKAELAELAASIQAARANWVSIKDYHVFRRELVLPESPISPVSTVAPSGAVAVIVDARDRSPGLIDLTLDSLRRSRIPTAPLVITSENQHAMFRSVSETAASGNFVLTIDAGVTLDERALGWLIHAIEITGSIAAYGDDDRATGEDQATVWSSPAFHPAFHPLDLATTPRIPAAILFRSRLPELAGKQDRRAWLMEALGAGRAAHVPLLLATTREPAEAAPLLPPAAVPAGAILAVIPTRDEGAALAAMIESLESNAAQRSQLEIVVVDNGSRDPETLALLAALVREKRIRVLSLDEPFNWSRLNNLAVAGSTADLLLFANNDMQMVTAGWDDRLRASLLQPGVGVIGARLVYPGGLLQHGGMALGALDGKPVHEGLGATPAENGPLDRWRRTRPAAALTGAFMGVRREIFEQVGGFNAVEFAVGCNDIDFCLRVREQGWSVLYVGDLELIHRESHSRGHDDTEDRMRRAQGELEALFRIWGAEAGHDPGRNPHWVSHETLLYHGVRQPSVDQVEAWMRRSVDLWRVRARES